MTTAMRYAVAALALGGAGALALGMTAPAAHGQASFVQDGKAGFVVADIGYALSQDAAQTGACPQGMTTGYSNFGDVFVDRPDLQRGANEVEDQYIQRVFRQAMSDPNSRNLCQNPELGRPDPNWRTVRAANIPAYGIDLDGQNSTANGRAAPGTCAHDDFRGMNGERGVDNQFFRVVGCSNSFQTAGQSNTFSIEMLTGSWGILITLAGVDDIRNDNDVTVGFYSNADPIQLSPNREPISGATYAIEQDDRYRAVTHGRIVNGVLTTDPVDVQWHWVVNSLRLDRPLRQARLRMTVGPDGTLDGFLAGYTPVEAMYNFQFGFRDGKDGNGQLAPLQLRTVSSIGYAATQGHTCQGAYYALQAAADGLRDASGHCTGISTQYRIRAIPAFVVDTATRSVNSDLDRDQPRQ